MTTRKHVSCLPDLSQKINGSQCNNLNFLVLTSTFNSVVDETEVSYYVNTVCLLVDCCVERFIQGSVAFRDTGGLLYVDQTKFVQLWKKGVISVKVLSMIFFYFARVTQPDFFQPYASPYCLALLFPCQHFPLLLRSLLLFWPSHRSVSFIF
jgi:hypothetical protein